MPQNRHRAYLTDPMSGKRFGLYRGPEGRLLASPVLGRGPPTVVISIPKAGTYLLARLLQEMGFVDVELHLSDFFLTDYRGLTIEQKRAPGVRNYNVPISVSAGLIGEGQFAVGHLKPQPWGRASLGAFRRIFLKRDLADAVFSHLRFFDATGRGLRGAPWRGLAPSPQQALSFVEDMGAQLFRDEYIPLADWMDDPDVFVVSFEELYGDFGPGRRQAKLDQLAAFLDADLERARPSCEGLIGSATKTWSGARTDLSVYWSEEVRRRLLDLGLNELNARLGYAPR